MPARLQHAQTFGPQVHVVGDAGRVPSLPHEPEFVGRVGDDGVDRAVGQRRDDLAAVAVAQLHGHAAPSTLSSLTALAKRWPIHSVTVATMPFPQMR